MSPTDVAERTVNVGAAAAVANAVVQSTQRDGAAVFGGDAGVGGEGRAGITVFGASRGIGATLFTGFALVVIAGAIGYWQLFSSFARYDDEGYVLQSLRSYQAGAALYSEMFTQYGPGYYVVQDMVHSLTRWPVTHDVARWKTLLVWLGTSLVGAGLLWRLSGSRLLALIGFAATFVQLEKLGLEPGHPQDQVLPLIGAAMLAGTWFTRDAAGIRQLLSASLGLLTGLLLATKINCGALLGLSLTIAFVGSLPAGRWRQLLWWSCVFAATVLPWALARRQAFTLEGAELPVAIACGWIGVLLQSPLAGRAASEDIRWSSLWLYVAATLVSFAGWCAAAWSGGTTLEWLWYGVVGQHRAMPDIAYHHPPLPWWSLIASVGGLLLAMQSRRGDRARRIAQFSLCGVLGFVVLRMLVESCIAIGHGLDERAGLGELLAVVLPLAWCLWPVREEDGNRVAYRLLVASTLVQPLMMYPTPGTQMAIGSLPAMWLALAMLGEWLRGPLSDRTTARSDNRLETASQAFARREEMQSGSSAPLFGLFATSIAAVISLTLGLRAHAAFSHWAECEPLGLAGAAQLRLPPDEAAERRAAAHYLMQHGTTFIASPTGCCSFYLWTELPPPTNFNTTYWEVLLTEQQQRDVVVSMEMSKTPLLLIDHGQSPVRYTDSRLHQYLTGRYKTIWRSGRFEVRRIRSNRQAFY